jgi:hypothetical protein
MGLNLAKMPSLIQYTFDLFHDPYYWSSTISDKPNKVKGFKFYKSAKGGGDFDIDVEYRLHLRPVRTIKK